MEFKCDASWFHRLRLVASLNHGQLNQSNVANYGVNTFTIMHSDAEDAVKARDGYDYDGYRLRVEFPRGGGPGSYRGGSGAGGGIGSAGGGGSTRAGSERNGGRDGGSGAGAGGIGGGRGNRGPVTKRSQFRVLVSGLPSSGSWQDLKDHMREAGDVCFADTYKDGTGVVEFLRHEDMKYAIKKLDDSRFRSHEVSATWREAAP